MQIPNLYPAHYLIIISKYSKMMLNIPDTLQNFLSINVSLKSTETNQK